MVTIICQHGEITSKEDMAVCVECVFGGGNK